MVLVNKCRYAESGYGQRIVEQKMNSDVGGRSSKDRSNESDGEKDG